MDTPPDLLLHIEGCPWQTLDALWALHWTWNAAKALTEPCGSQDTTCHRWEHRFRLWPLHYYPVAPAGTSLVYWSLHAVHQQRVLLGHVGIWKLHVTAERAWIASM